MRKIFKKVIDKIGKLTGTKKEEKKSGQKSWEERKAELLAKAPGGKNTTPKPKETEKFKNSQKKQQPQQKITHPLKKKENRSRPDVEIQSEKKPEAKKVEKKWNASEFKVEPAEGKVRFQDFDLPDEIMHAVYDLGFKYCTPIQSEILGNTLEGNDAIGQAQTGTGKTAAFLITIFSRFLKDPNYKKPKPGFPSALVIAPTRELVIQITNDADLLGKYTNLKVVTIFGGMNYQKQHRLLGGTPIDVIIATPGRLLDFMKKKAVNLSGVKIIVLDEADRMMDMGFIPDTKEIVRATPKKEDRQTLFFSATLTGDVRRLASSWTRGAHEVTIEPEDIAVKSVDQKCFITTTGEKYKLLYNIITKNNLERVIVFANRRDETRLLENLLYRHGISCAVLSGDVDQKKRIKTLDDFKSGNIRVLVATDVAGRGIHIEGVSHVINYTLPEDPEDYVHRIGRTGRAGASGISVSFACEDDSFQIPDIEKYLGKKLECTQPDEQYMVELPEFIKESKPAAKITQRSYPPKPQGKRNYYNREKRK